MNTTLELLDHAAAFTLAGVLMSSAFGQAVHRERFSAAVATYVPLPPLAAAIVGVIVTLGVGASATLLAWTETRAIGLFGTGMMLLLFASAMSLALLRGREIADCGCNLFARPRPASPGLALRNAAVGVGCLALAGFERSPSLMLGAIGAVVALCATAGWRAARQLLENRGLGLAR